MSLHRRLRRLEQRSSVPGVCPVCGFGPDDVRTVLAVCPDGVQRPLPPGPPEPPRQRCPRCGGWMGPIRLAWAVAPANGMPSGEGGEDDSEVQTETNRRQGGEPG